MIFFEKKLFCAIWLLLALHAVSPQRTELDIAFKDLYRPMRLLALEFVGRSGDNPQNVQKVQKAGKTQKLKTRSLMQFCDTQHGPGVRSVVRPKSVHRLRPGDIDVIGALGDSLTAGNGIFATNLLHVAVENRGVVWSIGGQYNWRKYLTLPNILKEFNPNLYGYSIKDGLSTDRTSRFNVAEAGAMSRDMPYMATVLVKRMQRDPKVNMTHDWKLVTMLIGNNDICSDVCYYPNPEETIKWHEQNMLQTYRYLRDNVPRLMLNVVPAPNLLLLNRLKLPPICRNFYLMGCSCLFDQRKDREDYFDDLIKRWIAKDFEIASRTEFNTNTFTINVQPFLQIKDFPLSTNGKTDIRYLSVDCFHLSQRGNAVAANALWNNMLEDPEEKSILNSVILEKFNCPTEKRPFIVTRENSKKDFVI